MKKFSISKILSSLKWIGILLAFGLIVYFVYKLYSWIKGTFALTIPMTAAPGQTLVQTQQNYLAQQVPPPSANQSSPWQGVNDLITTDNLTWTDKLWLYTNTLNPFRQGGWISDLFGSTNVPH